MVIDKDGVFMGRLSGTFKYFFQFKLPKILNKLWRNIRGMFGLMLLDLKDIKDEILSIFE